MKILLAHDYYQRWGGEDTVFEAEAALLESRGSSCRGLPYGTTTYRR